MSLDVRIVALGDYPKAPQWNVAEVDIGATVLASTLATTSGVNAVEDNAHATTTEHVGWLRHLRDNRTGPLVLYWAGHGELPSDGYNLALLDSTSPLDPSESLRLDTLATFIERCQRGVDPEDPDTWLVVVLDACHSTPALAELRQRLSNHLPPQTAVLSTSSLVGASAAGRFPELFVATLTGYAAEMSDRLSLRELLGRVAASLGREHGASPDDFLASRLTDHPEWPRSDTPDPLTGVRSEVLTLRQLLATAPDTVRNHYYAKASSATRGQTDWYFTGRVDQRSTLANWLQTDEPHGLYAVTGLAGSGKSALLGMILAATSPDMVEALRQLGKDVPERAIPHGVEFTSTLYLSNRTLTEVITAIAQQERLPTPGTADELIQAIQSAPRDCLILADALDESRDPLPIARLLRRLAATDRCRVLVGTRRSLTETPDQPIPTTHELTDALKPDRTLSIEPDRADFTDYATERLTAVLPDDPANIQRLARSIAHAAPTFLYVRLAVDEIGADPNWAHPHTDLADLLTTKHIGIFHRAVQRLRREHPNSEHLLHALAYARGNGFPRTGRVWETAGSAVAHTRLTDADVADALIVAAPYIMQDTEFGQEVYRLAHKTFVDYYRPPKHS